MELAFSQRAITAADLLPLECLRPLRRRWRGRQGCWIERLERRISCSADTGMELPEIPLVIDHTTNGSWLLANGMQLDVVNGNASVHPVQIDPSGERDIKDHSFGDGGIAVHDLFDQDSAQSIAVQKDGKVLVAGWSGPRLPDEARGSGGEKVTSITVVRLDADGSLDKSFANNGVANFGADANSGHWHGGDLPIALLDDGTILVGGHGVRKLDPDGTLDTDFGDGGAILQSPTAPVAVDQGNIGGNTYGSSDTVVHAPPFDPTRDAAQSAHVVSALGVTAEGKIVTADGAFHFRRFNADGTPDTTFGAHGLADIKRTLPDGNKNLYDMVLQPDGKIVGVGTLAFDHELHKMSLAVVRLNADGSRDGTFGDDGLITLHDKKEDGWMEGYSVALAADGKIVVGGQTRYGGMVLVRYNADGSLDGSFGDGGIAFQRHLDGYPYDMLIDADGKILVADNAVGGINVHKFNSDGTVDTTFGHKGRSITMTQTGDARWNAFLGGYGIALAPDGDILVAGQVELGNSAGSMQWSQDHADFMVVRLNGDNSTSAPEAEIPEEPAPPPSDQPDGVGEGSAGGDDDATSAGDAAEAAATAAGLTAFSSLTLAGAFDFDDPTGAKKELMAELEDELASA